MNPMKSGAVELVADDVDVCEHEANAEVAIDDEHAVNEDAECAATLVALVGVAFIVKTEIYKERKYTGI
jgi:hypothetical protein